MLGNAAFFTIDVMDNSGIIDLRLTAYPGSYDRKVNYQWNVRLMPEDDVMDGLQELVTKSAEFIPKAHARKIEKERG